MLGLVLVMTSTTQAAAVMYDIDFGGDFTQFPSWNVYDVEVTGTITLDPDLPVVVGNMNSNLEISVTGPGASNWPVQLPAIPIFSNDAATALDWVDVSGNLFITSNGVGGVGDQGVVKWIDATGINIGGFSLGGDVVGNTYSVFARVFGIDRGVGVIPHPGKRVGSNWSDR